MSLKLRSRSRRTLLRRKIIAGTQQCQPIDISGYGVTLTSSNKIRSAPEFPQPGICGLIELRLVQLYRQRQDIFIDLRRQRLGIRAIYYFSGHIGGMLWSCLGG